MKSCAIWKGIGVVAALSVGIRVYAANRDVSGASRSFVVSSLSVGLWLVALALAPCAVDHESYIAKGLRVLTFIGVFIYGLLFVNLDESGLGIFDLLGPPFIAVIVMLVWRLVVVYPPTRL